MPTREPVLSTRSTNLIDNAIETGAIAYWQEDQGNGAAVGETAREADAAKLKLMRHVARVEARVGINIENFTALVEFEKR